MLPIPALLYHLITSGPTVSLRSFECQYQQTSNTTTWTYRVTVHGCQFHTSGSTRHIPVTHYQHTRKQKYYWMFNNWHRRQKQVSALRQKLLLPTAGAVFFPRRQAMNNSPPCGVLKTLWAVGITIPTTFRCRHGSRQRRREPKAWNDFYRSVKYGWWARIP